MLARMLCSFSSMQRLLENCGGGSAPYALSEIRAAASAANISTAPMAIASK